MISFNLIYLFIHHLRFFLSFISYHLLYIYYNYLEIINRAKILNKNSNSILKLL